MSQQLLIDQKHTVRPLSPRQTEILMLLVERGMTQNQIALELACSRTTVKNHLTKIREKMGVETLYQAIAVATVRGLVNAQECGESGDG